MIKSLHLLVFLFLGASALNDAVAQTEEPQELTTIIFETKTIDYGTITKGADGQREFVFTNTGDHDFVLKNVFSSCNCDIISKPEVPIAPGEKGKILVTYDTKKLGPIVKTITIMGNIPQKAMALKLTGMVKDI